MYMIAQSGSVLPKKIQKEPLFSSQTTLGIAEKNPVFFSNESASPRDISKDAELQLKFLKFLVMKYSDIINDFEKKTVGEIKALIDADDLSVQSIAIEFKKEGYEFEKDFPEASQKAFDFVKNEIQYVKPQLDLNFWLSPKEILNEKIGDDKDLSVFLCSLLAFLGDNNAEVIVSEMDDGSTHAFVATEFGGKFFVLDPSQKHEFGFFSGKKSGVLEKYSFNGAKIIRFLYRFNRQKYEQFMN